MAFAANKLATNLVGYFTEKDYGRPFEYTVNTSPPVYLPDMKTGRNTLYPHHVFVGPQGDQVRIALVKKTVAYVVVDQDIDWSTGGITYTTEKWSIKNHGVYG